MNLSVLLSTSSVAQYFILNFAAISFFTQHMGTTIIQYVLIMAVTAITYYAAPVAGITGLVFVLLINDLRNKIWRGIVAISVVALPAQCGWAAPI